MSRNLLFAWLPLAAVVAAGLAWLPRPWSAIATLVLLVPLTAVTMQDQVDDRLKRPDWRAVTAALGPVREDRVVLGPEGLQSLPLSLYLHTPARLAGTEMRAREVVAVAPRTAGFYSRERCHGPGTLCDFAPADPPPRPLPGLRLASRLEVADGRFLLVRYVAREPVVIDDASIGRFGLVNPAGDAPMAFLQRP